MEYKAYSFDLDDNLLKMPTKIYLEDSEGIKQAYSTLDFEKIRTRLDELGLKIIDESFASFEDDEQFMKDLGEATEAGSWGNLVNCVVKHASIFAIITARGHAPETLKEGMKKIILERLSLEQLDKFKLKFSERTGTDYGSKTHEEVLGIYLNLCKFYPVSHSSIKEEFGHDKSTGMLKAATFQEFRNYIHKYVKDNHGEDVEIKVGFSDDSIANLSSIVNEMLKQHGLFFYHTKENSKKMDFI
ncbi:hypothetical protein HN747_00390 [archaeon]|jgi:hypothetical protein|nr:hypothetical protein [archaeon]